MTTVPILLAAALAAQTFNLDCSGTKTTSDIFDGHRSQPYTDLYRINLETKQWCEEDCKGLFPLDVSSGSLMLQRVEVYTRSEISSLTNLIDRKTGEHSIYWTYKRPGDPASIMNSVSKGTCVKTPFTGFPTFETKF